MLKLNLGCGKNIKEGYVNIDITSSNNKVIKSDIRRLPQYEDNSIDEIFLNQVLEHLNNKDFVLLDVQFTNPHLDMFGAIEISFEEYNDLLSIAYSREVNFI